MQITPVMQNNLILFQAKILQKKVEEFKNHAANTREAMENLI